MGMEKMTPTSKVGSVSNPIQEEEMDVELEETLHDTIPGYLINLHAPSDKSPAELSPNRRHLSTEMPELEDVPQDDGGAEEEVGTEAKEEERSSSSSSESGSCSYSSLDSEEEGKQEDEPVNGGEINKYAYNELDLSYLQQLQSEEIATGGDESHLQQLEAEYKGTETTREEMCRVTESYHTTPNVTDDDLLRGEAMDASPRTETTLLAETADTPATGVGCGISEEETLAAVASIYNPSMPTEVEFLNTNVDMEESPESFEALSHRTPHLPDISEVKPPTATDRTPKKK